MAFALTENAAKEVKRAMTEGNMPETALLRVGIRAGGCSGFEYDLGFDTATDEARDHVFEQHGLKVAVDKKSYLYLDGATLDHYDGLERRGFFFSNPNVVKSCGCGHSFSA